MTSEVRKPSASAGNHDASGPVPDAGPVRTLIIGCGNILRADDAAGPVFLCSDRRLARDRVAATEVKDLCLRLLGP